jgi:hypothetical protein
MRVPFELQVRHMINHNSAGRASPKSDAPTLTRKRKQPTRLDLGKLIRAQFSDGKWHSFETIITTTGAPAKNVWSTLDLMKRWGTYKTKCERKKVGTEYRFRLSPADKQISVQELIEKLNPSSRSWKFKVEQTQRRCHRRLCAL